MTMTMDTGMTNTGDQTLGGVMAIGYTILMDITAYIMSGITLGGGIGIGGIVIGAIILTGTSSARVSISSGMKMDAGGGGHGMEGG